jgi:SpoVK/Ycf46/Vps4 family AAA+-type ATPase
VAETMKRPLYSMSAGDLGDDPSTFESNLIRVLELSTRWSAVLVIDECDVFLEKRTSSDLARNKLVSVLLRQLEYFQGVMFLTTNRVAAFDPAFESRIHLTIHYPKLDMNSRRHIWRTFVKPDGASYTSDIREADLDKLAQTELNGRQIKNVVQTSRLLAARDKSPLSMDHIAVVLRVKAVDSADIASSQLPDKPSTGRHLSNYAWGLFGRYL